MTPWQRLKRQLQQQLRWLLILYAVVGLIGSLITLFVAVAPKFDSAPVGSAPDFGRDFADSWNRFNDGTATTTPSWTVDEVIDAVGDARGGEVITMDGAQSVVDTAAVRTALAGTDRIVILTPPTPLAASETTRLRDNSVQQSWADEHGLSAMSPAPSSTSCRNSSARTRDPSRSAIPPGRAWSMPRPSP